jgi:hypothetical protein
MQILVQLEGVMRGPDDELIGVGTLMYGTLTAYNRMTIMTSQTRQLAEYWMNVNKIVDFDHLIDSSVHLEGENLAERQIRHARSLGGIDLFITNDPNLWAFAFNMGIPSVMFGVPSYTRPEFRPDAPRQMRAWNEIEEAINKQNELRTKDVRLTRTDGLNFEG